MDSPSFAILRINQRSRRDYQAAHVALNKTIRKSMSSKAVRIAFPELDSDVPLEAGIRQLEDGIEDLILVLNGGSQPATNMQKVKLMIKRWFESSYPFASLFLMVAKEAANVLFPSKLATD